MKVKPIVIIVIAFACLIGMRLVWLELHKPPEQPVVHEGVLDLTTFTLPQTQSIILNGQWNFSPNQFSTTSSSNEQFVAVPSYTLPQDGTQYGTYTMRILLPPTTGSNELWGLKLPTILTAYELYINNQLVDASGTIAMNATNHSGTGFSNRIYFLSEEKSIDITLFVSNFDTNEGIGIAKSIHFGYGEAIDKEHTMNEVLTISLVVVLLLFSVFSLLVYLFIYKNKMVLFFTFGFLLPAIDEMTTFNPSLLQYIPLNYEWTIKFLNLIYLGAAFFFIQFMRQLLTNYRNSKLFTYYSWLYLLGAIIIVTLPISKLTDATTSFFVLYGVSFLSVVVLALREYIVTKETSIFLALTALCTTSGITWGAIKGILSLEVPFYPFDYLFGLIFFAAFWFNHFHLLRTKANNLIIQLQDMDEQRDAFLEESAQKLWGPLNEMITIGQTTYDTDHALAKSSKENMRYIIDIGRSMSFTLTALIDFTKLKDNRMTLEHKPFQVQSLIPALFDILQFITKDKQIKMTSYIPNDFPSVIGDEQKIFQVLFNTFHNAVKYTSKGDIYIQSAVVNGFAQFEIQDTGIGISKDALAHVTESFVQINEGDKGIGIGLTVAKELILLHGGTFDIFSEETVGTTIRFSLPLAESSTIPINEKLESFTSNPVPAEVEQVIRTEKPYTVLVIDDDPVNLTVIEQIFSSEDSHIVTTRTSADALALLTTADWDLLIIDAMMPIESGYSLTQIIRQRFTKLELPILLLTAHSDPLDVYTALALGANDYVTKPINALELKIRGHALIDLKHSIRDRSQMETALLQAQIQPHFLFNTLNSIAALSTIDSDRMILLLDHFGKYLQSSFDTSNLNAVVPIEQELELIEAYLYIQQERFQKRLTVEWDLTYDNTFDIPPLLLQTLVENAVQHGVLRKVDGGTVTIVISEQRDHFRIQIKDDGVGIEQEQLSTLLKGPFYSSENIGLRNSNRRLSQLFNEELHITSTVVIGTTVSIRIPK